MRSKKLKPCPFCFDTMMLSKRIIKDKIEIRCDACNLIRLIVYPKTTVDKTTKLERETTDIEKLNYAVEKWNEYYDREMKIFTDGMVKGYGIGVEDTENGESYTWLK